MPQTRPALYLLADLMSLLDCAGCDALWPAALFPDVSEVCNCLLLHFTGKLDILGSSETWVSGCYTACRRGL